MDNWEIAEIEGRARSIGLNAHVVAGGRVYISTPFGGHWVIIPAGNHYRLEHENYKFRHGYQPGTYHRHTAQYPDIFNAMQYISVHDASIPKRRYA